MNFLVRMQKVTNRINKIVSRCFTEIGFSGMGFGRCIGRLRASWLVEKHSPAEQCVRLHQQHVEARPSPDQTLETLSNISKQSFSTFIVPYTKFTAISSQSLLGNAQNCFSYRRLSCHNQTVASFYLQKRIVAHLLVVHGTVSYHSRLFVLLTVIICNTWNSSGQNWFIKKKTLAKWEMKQYFYFWNVKNRRSK